MSAVAESSRPLFPFLATGYLFILVSRGLLQLALPPSIAMMTQIGLVTLSLLLLDGQSLFLFPARLYPLLGWGGGLLSSGLISMALTTANGHREWLAYGGFTFFCALSGLVLAKMALQPPQGVRLHRPLLAISWLLLVVATVEQLGWITLPGASRFFLLRPASLTGSALHYPLLLPLLAFCLFQWYAQTGNRRYLWSGLILCIALLTTLSRSGLLILCLAFSGLFLCRMRKDALFASKLLLLALSTLLLLLALWFYADANTLAYQIVDRLFTMANPEAAGNADRLYKWSKACAYWRDSNKLFGEMTGIATNSGYAIGNQQVFIAESGFFQQLLNYGLVGLFCFYGFYLSLGLLILPKHLYLRAVYFSCLLQTFVYQSVEAVSFMLLLSSLPWISRTYDLCDVSA